MDKNIVCVFAFISVCLILSAAKPETTGHGADSHKTAHFKGGVHNPVFDMEALIGSQAGDHLDDLPEDVRLKRLRILAVSHDKNLDGIIDMDELKAWILQSFKMLDHEEANERFTDDDENQDGKVTLGELLHKQYSYTEEDIAAMQEKHKDSEKPLEGEEEEIEVLSLILDDKKRFAAADQDNDGALSGDEYMAYLQPYDYAHMLPVEMERAMRDMDKDKDGLVSMEEFVGDQDDEETRFSEESTFEELDKDKDGKLTPEELRPYALPDNSDIAFEEAEHLHKECDENGDGKLSLDEVVNKEEEFLGSSATDYGRHLHFIKEEL